MHVEWPTTDEAVASLVSPTSCHPLHLSLGWRTGAFTLSIIGQGKGYGVGLWVFASRFCLPLGLVGLLGSFFRFDGLTDDLVYHIFRYIILFFPWCMDH